MLGTNSFFFLFTGLLCLTNIVYGWKISAERYCDISLTSAFSHLTTGKSYLVKGEMVWRMKDNYTLMYPPRKVSEIFQGIPENFDDAFPYGKNYQTYIFKGSKYWRLISGSTKAAEGYPLLISEGWPGIPNDIDAVFNDHKFQTYFLKGDLIYKYDHTREAVSDGYPRKIKEEFAQLQESSFDTAFEYYNDRMVYFFKGLKFWKMAEDQSVMGPYVIKSVWKNLCVPTDIDKSEEW